MDISLAGGDTTTSPETRTVTPQSSSSGDRFEYNFGRMARVVGGEAISLECILPVNHHGMLVELELISSAKFVEVYASSSSNSEAPGKNELYVGTLKCEEIDPNMFRGKLTDSAAEFGRLRMKFISVKGGDFFLRSVRLCYRNTAKPPAAGPPPSLLNSIAAAAGGYGSGLTGYEHILEGFKRSLLSDMDVLFTRRLDPLIARMDRLEIAVKSLEGLLKD